MKFLKTKVAAGVVAVGMLASMGTVFAATDAGGQLHNWYNTASDTVIAAIKGDFTSYKSDKLAAHNTTVNNAINKAREDIRDAGNNQIKNVNTTVTNQVAQYSSQLDAANNDIAGGIAKTFNDLVTTTNLDSDTQLGSIKTQNEKDINNAIKNHKGVYMGRLDTETAPTIASKKTELTNKIAQIKQALSDALAQEKTDTTAAITSHLQTELTSLEAQLQALTDAGVKAATDEINAKGTTILNNSLSDLDAIVDSIDN